MEKSHPNAGVSQGRQSINIKGMKIVYVAFGKKELSPGGPFVLALTLNQAPPCFTHLRPWHTFQIFSSHNTLPNLWVLSIGQRSIIEMKHK